VKLGELSDREPRDLCSAGEWRADAAEEWRLSPESQLLDLTFEEVS